MLTNPKSSHSIGDTQSIAIYRIRRHIIKIQWFQKDTKQSVSYFGQF